MSMARSAAQGATVQTVPKVPIPASTGLCAYCVQKVNLAVLLEHLISRRVKTALPVDILPLLEFLRSRTATCAVLESFRAKRERLRHAPNALQASTRMKRRLRPVSVSPTGPSYWVVRLL